MLSRLYAPVTPVTAQHYRDSCRFPDFAICPSPCYRTYDGVALPYASPLARRCVAPKDGGAVPPGGRSGHEIALLEPRFPAPLIRRRETGTGGRASCSLGRAVLSCQWSRTGSLVYAIAPLAVGVGGALLGGAECSSAGTATEVGRKGRGEIFQDRNWFGGHALIAGWQFARRF